MPSSRRYYAYILRGWLEDTSDDAQHVWRFRLRNVRTDEERAFTNLEAVTVFLAQAFDRDDEDDSSSQ